MTEPDFEAIDGQQVVDYVETCTNDNDRGMSRLFSKALEKFKAAGDEARAGEMCKEMIAFDLFATNSDGGRFAPKISGTAEDGTPVSYPDWEVDFTPVTLDYYKRRLDETANPALKARYADILWEKREDHTYGRPAAGAYLDCAPLYYDENMILEFGDALTRALILAARLSDKALVRECVDTHHDFIRRIVADKRFRPMLEVADSLLAQFPKLKGAAIDLTLLADALDATVEDYAENDPDNYLIRESILERLIKLRALQKDNDGVTAAKVRLAETFVEEAEAKGANQGNYVAAHFYEKALKVYVAMGGFDTRVAELKVKIQQANEAAVRTEFTTISTPIEIPVAPIEERLGQFYKGRSATEVFQIMTGDPRLVPSYSRALELADDVLKEFVLQHLFSTRVVRPGNIAVKNVTTDADKRKYQAIQLFQREYHLTGAVYLDRIFAILKDEHPDYLDDLGQFLASSEMIGAERVAILRHGLRAVGREEYAAAIHILTLQVEGILRDALGKAGLPTWAYQRGSDEMRARTLTDILDTLEKVNGFDKDFLKFIDILLNDVMGDNLRNEIAHALAPVEAFNRQNTELVLLILIKLVPYGIVRPETAQQAQINDASGPAICDC